jgi:heptaprenyl diphosphate synthase
MSELSLNKLNPITRLAFFTAFAVTIFAAESLIPKPLPFMKLGLANIVVIFILINFGFRDALIVTVTKSVIGGFVAGIIFTPTMIMSFGGSLSSVLMMYMLLNSRIKFSIIGISIIGAVSHNITQLVIVRFLLIKESSVFYLTPILIIMGVVTGIVTGYIAFVLNKKMQEKIL